LYALSYSFAETKQVDVSVEREKELPKKETSKEKKDIEEKVESSVKPENTSLKIPPAAAKEEQPELVPVSENEISESAGEEEKKPDMEEKTSDTLFDETGIKSEPEKEEDAQEQKIKPENEKSTPTKSTIDLFSDTVEETIADKFGSKGDSSIAKKMQQQSIEDLRQAIGINEKFLFINGLFNGDLGRYNKAIDEFNELSTKEGVNAHFLELKIHNQWSDDNEGVVKLKALLDRKFN